MIIHFQPRRKLFQRKWIFAISQSIDLRQTRQDDRFTQSWLWFPGVNWRYSAYHCADYHSTRLVVPKEASQHEVSCFVNFPPEIWANLATYLSGEQLGRIKMTGSKSLWNKLRSPRVVTSVKLGDDFINFKSWPAFLNEFTSLEQLSI